MDYVYMVHYASPHQTGVDEFVMAFLSNQGAQAYIAEEREHDPEFAECLYVIMGRLYP